MFTSFLRRKNIKHKSMCSIFTSSFSAQHSEAQQKNCSRPTDPMDIPLTIRSSTRTLGPLALAARALAAGRKGPRTTGPAPPGGPSVSALFDTLLIIAPHCSLFFPLAVQCHKVLEEWFVSAPLISGHCLLRCSSGSPEKKHPRFTYWTYSKLMNIVILLLTSIS